MISLSSDRLYELFVNDFVPGKDTHVFHLRVIKFLGFRWLNNWSTILCRDKINVFSLPRDKVSRFSLDKQLVNDFVPNVFLFNELSSNESIHFVDDFVLRNEKCVFTFE